MNAADIFGIVIFVLIVSLTMYITYWASKRNRDASDFYAAGRSLTGMQNGFAIAGDYLSAASFLGIAGLVALHGYDGFMYAVGWLMGYVIVLYIVAEPFRNSGKFTLADVLSFRLSQRPVRSASAVVTLAVTLFYMVAQLVGAGAIIQLLVGIPYEFAIIFIGILMIIYVSVGGMLATSWVQIIKAVLLMSAMIIMILFIGVIFNFNINSLFGTVIDTNGVQFLEPGQLYTNPIDLFSLGMALILGTAGLPHLLVRFYTVPSAQAARKSVIWAMGIIGIFYILITFIGFAASSLVGRDRIMEVDAGGNMAAPLLGAYLGGGEGTFGGELFMSAIAAVAFATIIAVVAGLVITGAGAFAHDIYTNVIKRGEVDSDKQFKVARRASLVIGILSILIGILAKDMNVAYLVVLAFCVGASANLPVFIFSIYWKRFNTTGAVASMLIGTIAAVGLVMIGPSVMGDNAIFPLANPGVVSIPLGFLSAIVFTFLGKRDEEEAKYSEMTVRANTGIEAE